MVGCTPDTDARDNTSTTGTGVPIYWLNGNKVADDYADFYDGDWNDEANDKNESGTNGPDTSQRLNYPLTGCQNNGTEAFEGSTSRGLGGSGTYGVAVGRPNSSTTGRGPLYAGRTIGVDKELTGPMYGLSAVFQVGAVDTNNPPTFSAAIADRSVAENTAAGQDVGAVLTATDADSDTLTYTLEDTDAASFDIVTISGSAQIRTKTGVTYNHEAKSTYTVMVKADDGNGGTDTITVTITTARCGMSRSRTVAAEPPTSKTRATSRTRTSPLAVVEVAVAAGRPSPTLSPNLNQSRTLNPSRNSSVLTSLE